MERGAFHAWHELDDACFADIHDEAVDDLVAKITVSHLTSAEAERCFDLVSLGEEAHGLVLLRLVVVLVYGDGEFDLFDDDDLLLLARSAIALVLFVEILSIVLNAADGRHGIRGDLNQVKGTFARNLQRLEWLHDAELLAVLVDHADFAGADLFVGADKGF